MGRSRAAWCGTVPHGPDGFRAGAAVRRGLPRRVRAAGQWARRRVDALSSVHDRARCIDWHGQHRRRRDRDRVGRTRRAVLDLGLRLRGDRDQVCRGGARHDLSGSARRSGLVGADVLPQRWPAFASPRLALRIRRRHRGADDDAVLATELNGAGAGLGAGDSANRLGHRDCRADVARHHRRHQVDRQDRREAVAAQGRALPRRRSRRHPDECRAHPRRAVDGRARSVDDAIGVRVWDVRRDALRDRARHLRE